MCFLGIEFGEGMSAVTQISGIRVAQSEVVRLWMIERFAHTKQENLDQTFLVPFFLESKT